MRALLGAGKLLKNCKYRIRWYCKEKTLLPQKEISERIKKANEARSRRLTTHLSRLRMGNAKKTEPETPAMEILCRALATSSGSSSSNVKSKKGSVPQQSECPSDHGNKTLYNPPNPPENRMQESKIQLDKANSETLEIFNCKICHENSSGEDLESPTKSEKCQNNKANESVLKKETSSSAEQQEEPQQCEESSIVKQAPVEDSEKLQDKPIVKDAQEQAKATNSQSDVPFPLGRNPCIDGKRGNGEKSKDASQKESSCNEENMKAESYPEVDETKSKSQEEPSQEDVVEPEEQKAKQENTELKVSKEAALRRSSCTEQTEDRSNERKFKKTEKKKTTKPVKEQAQEKVNPKIDESKTPAIKDHKDGKRENADESKDAAQTGSSVPCPKLNAKLKVNCNKPQVKKSSEKSPAKGTAQESVKPEIDESKKKTKENASQEAMAEPKEQKVEPVNPPGKKGNPPQASPAPLDGKKSKDVPKSNTCTDKVLQPMPCTKLKVQKDDPSKATTQSQPPKDWKQPPLPTSDFNFPLLSAFPSGRNPCRDGPRGGSKNELKPEGTETEAEGEAEGEGELKKEPKQPYIEDCDSFQEMIEESSSKEKASNAPKKAEAQAKEISNSAKSEKTLTGLKSSESLPLKETIKSTEKLKSDAQKASASVSSKEESKRLQSSEKLINEAQKASASISSKKESQHLKDTKKVRDETQKAAASILNKEKSRHLEATKKVKNEAHKASNSVLNKEKVKQLDKSKKLITEAQKASASELNKEKTKKLDDSRNQIIKAQKASASVSARPPRARKPSMEVTISKDSKNSNKLKNLPAPPLDSTLEAYLDSIEPLLTEAEFENEIKLTEEFMKKEGPELQNLLEEAAASCKNWLTPRWTQAAYLAYQAPVTAFTSPALSFPVQTFKDAMECLTFTARAIRAIYLFKTLVDQNKIPVTQMGDNQLDNSQFSNIFGTVRKPGRFCDTIEQYCDSNYVVVVFQNNYFQLPIVSSSGNLSSVTSLVDELEAIINCPLPKGEPIGLLTHDNRGNWAEAYGAMYCQPGNADTLEAIEQSLFVVCLDECVPIPEGQKYIVQAHQLLHGGGLTENSANRWMDKTIQLIVNPNGLAGFCYEHSPAECQPLAMLMDYVMEKIQKEAESESGSDCHCECREPNKGNNSNPARHLRFLPADECINMWLHVAMRNISKIANQLQMYVFEYECHGKDFIKAQGLNSDSYIQMALQLAYYNMHKTIPAQYESAHLRMFVDGRTETIRSTSNKSKEFLEAMKCQNATEEDKLVALQEAVDLHEELTKRALHGEGIDRHLFGLQQMAVENCLPVPEFFKSKGFVRSVTFQLFTSQVATTHKSFMAYGPLTCDGYGCCYNPQENKISFAISAWKTSMGVNPEQYGKAIKKSLDSMRKLIVKTGGERVGEDPCLCEKILK
ncbi:hypothetical protein KR200_000015 [Drosophila serrata]|nr:hypothetical protein KR200_000015 [Drosophila serrata]